MTCRLCPAFLLTADSLDTGLCHGCRAPGPTMFIAKRVEPDFHPKVAPPSFVLALAERIFAAHEVLANRAERPVAKPWTVTEVDYPTEATA